MCYIGNYNIRRTGEHVEKLYFEDWFHSFASLSTKVVILTIISTVNIQMFLLYVVFHICIILGLYVLHIPSIWFY